MAKDEFDLGSLIGGIKSSVDSLAQTMTQQHANLGGRLDAMANTLAIYSKDTDKNIALIDKKLEKAHDRIDDNVVDIAEIKNDLKATTKKVDDIEDNKKKIYYTSSGIATGVGIGSGVLGGKLFSFLSWLFQ